MISSRDIMKLVKQYAKSPEGKEAIKRQTGLDYDEKFSEEDALKIAEDLRQILGKYLQLTIHSVNANAVEIFSPTYDKKGRLTIELGFIESELFRPSLNPDNNGLRNIVLLFQRGYTIGGTPPRGIWHGEETVALVRREPSAFLQDALREFNRKYEKVAVAKLQGYYIPGGYDYD